MTIYSNNKLFLIKKKLKFLVEVTLEIDGSINISPKLALLLTQSGIYDNTSIFDFLNDYFSFISVYEYEELLESKSFLVSFLFVFQKNKKKTKIYVFNPFYNSVVNITLKYNFLDFFIKCKKNINYFVFKFLEREKNILSDIYFNYILENILKPISLSKRKRFHFFYNVKKKYSIGYILYYMNRKYKKIRRKQVCKKVKYKRFVKFIFLFKSKKWMDYYLFFKIIVLSSYYFSGDYFYRRMKLSLYTFTSFSSLYKMWFVKRLKKKLKIRKNVKRNRLGELMFAIRTIQFDKKKNNAKKR